MCDVTRVGENVYDEKDEEVGIGQREMRSRPRRRTDLNIHSSGVRAGCLRGTKGSMGAQG